ncbi:hypothetical protein GCM10025777_38220 [Membranihabitans marinus]|uniref:Uncharacterized protein n=1 Tax=Nesterenkonia rhizosphaerae TaxID=1348272 RepID=A0ABP9G1P5_9MICC
MRRAGRFDITIGALAGVVAFYLLSLSSAFWAARLDPSYLSWSVILSVGASVILGIATTRRTTLLAAIATVMIVLVAVGLLLGSAMDDWALPLPFDFGALLQHGGRSPLVIGACVVVGVASLTRAISSLVDNSGSLSRDERREADSSRQ